MLPPAAAAPVLPVTVLDHVGNEVTIAAVDRIIPLDGTVAEVVFAGLGANVVATDLSATFTRGRRPSGDWYQRSLTAESIARLLPPCFANRDRPRARSTTSVASATRW